MYADSEMRLLPEVFSSVCSSLKVSPSIDWFASDLNAQLPRYCVWETSESTALFNAFAFSWTGEIGYFFPPFSLLPKVLQKICQDKANGLLITPFWPGASWMPSLKKITISNWVIPKQHGLLYFPGLPSLKFRLNNIKLLATKF